MIDRIGTGLLAAPFLASVIMGVSGAMFAAAPASAESLDCRQVTADTAASCCPALLGSASESLVTRSCNRVLGAGWKDAVVNLPGNASPAELKKAGVTSFTRIEIVDPQTGAKTVRILGLTGTAGSPDIFKDEPRLTGTAGSPEIFKVEPGKGAGIVDGTNGSGIFKEEPGKTSYSTGSSGSGGDKGLTGAAGSPEIFKEEPKK